jgi:hypothetical protein
MNGVKLQNANRRRKRQALSVGGIVVMNARRLWCERKGAHYLTVISENAVS